MLSRALEKRIIALARRKIRDEEGRFVAEGLRVVEDLIEAGIGLESALVSSALEDTDRGRALIAALARRVELHRVSDTELTRVAGTETPQGVLVVAETPRHDLAAVSSADADTVLVLDAVQDPGNFGTLVRTAEALGAGLVASLPGTVDPWNAKAVRAAAGSSFRIPIVPAEPDALLDWLRANAYSLYAADADGSPLEALNPPAKCALAVGNEGGGLSERMRAAADAVVAVPLRGRAESLNVGVAAGILLFQLTRRMR